MKVSLSPKDSSDLNAYLRRHVIEKYGKFTLAADHFGMCVSAFKKVMQNKTNPFPELLEDAGIRVSWSQTKFRGE